MLLTLSLAVTLSTLPAAPVLTQEALAGGKIEIIKPTHRKPAPKPLAPPSVEQPPLLDRSRDAAPSTAANCPPQKAGPTAEEQKAAEEKAAAEKAEAEKAENEKKARAARLKAIEEHGQKVRDSFGAVNDALSTGE